MSRYPFEEFSNEFMVSVQGIYSDAHHKSLARRYRRIGRDLRTLHADGRISTTSPKTMTAEDVKACFVHKMGLGHSAREYAHEVNAFILLFDYVGNMAVRTCLSCYPMLKPVSDHSRLPTISDSDRKRISEGMTGAVSSGDFRLIRSYAMLAIFLGCGPRTKELRLMDLKDLDTEEWTLDILHVKGEGRYGSPRTVPIPPEYRSIISAYLSIRPETGSPALFPPSRGDSDHLCGNSVRKILSFAMDDCGVRVDPRTLRRSFGQGYLDSGIDSIESVSVLMGHSTTNTTEQYYARRRNSMAIEAARRTWGIQTQPENDLEINEPEDKGSAEDGVRTHDLRISLEEVCRPEPYESDAPPG